MSTTGGIESLLSGMTDSQWDILIRVIHDLQDSSSVERLDALGHFLKTLTQEIDQINRKRDAMRQKVENAEALLPIIGNHLQTNNSVEVELLFNVVLSWQSSLKAEISETIPTGKIAKQSDTERKREFLAQIRKLVLSLAEKVTQKRAQKIVRAIPQEHMKAK